VDNFLCTKILGRYTVAYTQWSGHHRGAIQKNSQCGPVELNGWDRQLLHRNEAEPSGSSRVVPRARQARPCTEW